MTDNYLLKTADAQDIYFKIKDLPIVDYHCHLSPKEIYEDKPFDNIGEMWRPLQMAAYANGGHRRKVHYRQHRLARKIY